MRDQLDPCDPRDRCSSDPGDRCRELYACLHLAAGGGGPERLLLVARDFSPRIMRVADDEVLLDVSGLGRLIGEPGAIARELARALAAAGIDGRVAIGVTQTAARALARHAHLAAAPADVAAALAPLPVAVLKDIEAARSMVDGGARPGMNLRDRERPYETCARWGIATLGELAALPPADLASRLGRRGTALQRLARGLDPRPFVPDADTPRYAERLELEWPIEGLEPLSFVLARLLDPLAAALERADRAAAAIHLDLRLTDRSTHARVLQLPAPMRDPRVLRTLLLLDLESHPPSPLCGFGETGPPAAAIDIVAIELDPAPARITQFSLLERAVPSAETLSTLTARLSALAGESRIGSPVLLDSHRPDAFRMVEFTGQLPTANSQLPTCRIRTPWELGIGSWELSRFPVLRRHRPSPAIRVRVEHGRPVYVAAARRGMPHGAVVDAAGPWRTSGGWWQAPDACRAQGQGLGQGAKGGWSRDEWDVALTSGAMCRIYQDRVTECWFLGGTYD